MRTCGYCKGAGTNGTRACRNCDGTTRTDRGMRPCHTCNQTGQVPFRCPFCDGKGRR